MFGRKKTQHAPGADLVLMAGQRMRLEAVQATAARGGQLILALTGETSLTYLRAGRPFSRRAFGRRECQVSYLHVPVPTDEEELRQIVAAQEDGSPVNVYAAYRLRRGRAVALDSFTLVGDALYYDVDTRTPAAG